MFDHANRNGWALIRGNEAGRETSANLLVRLEGSDPSYPGGYEPTPERTGVPCFFDDNPDSTSWADVTGDEYVARSPLCGQTRRSTPRLGFTLRTAAASIILHIG